MPPERSSPAEVSRLRDLAEGPNPVAGRLARSKLAELADRGNPSARAALAGLPDVGPAPRFERPPRPYDVHGPRPGPPMSAEDKQRYQAGVQARSLRVLGRMIAAAGAAPEPYLGDGI